MSKEGLVIVFGALTALLPYAGLPSSWYRPLLLIVGLLILLVGVLLRSEALSRGESKGTTFFVDSRPPSDTPSFSESKPAPRVE